MMLETKNAHKEAIYFLAEQARVLTQAGSNTAAEDADVCRRAGEYLTDGDETLTAWLDEQINVNPSGANDDPEVEDYDGKDNDLTLALDDLMTLTLDETLPSEQREQLVEAREIIAEFYGKRD